MQKLSGKSLLLVSFTLFSMFFGAGNLIFPPHLGAQAGVNLWPAFAGLAVSAVGLPIAGVVAVAQAGGLDKLASRVHPVFAMVFTILVYLSIGPCLAIPRTASTSFQMLVPLIGGGTGLQLAYSVLFFTAAFLVALRPEKLTDWLGRILCPCLIVLIVVLLRGCASSAPETTPETPTATKTTTKKSSKKTEMVDEDEDTDEAMDESTDSDATKTTAKKEENEVTKVKVSVAKGKTAWIEVKVDGKSVYGAQATGPFEQEYTPESSIEITTSKPSDVTVTKNGEKVRYDTKTSGVARVTITVPKKETTDSENGESSDGAGTTDGTDGTDAQSTDGADTATDGQTPTDSTDYSYDSY